MRAEALAKDVQDFAEQNGANLGITWDTHSWALDPRDRDPDTSFARKTYSSRLRGILKKMERTVKSDERGEGEGEGEGGVGERGGGEGAAVE
ncbi:hypothetical protein BBJ29_008487 [Phytophthora kernoviae]|uniref:Uncharacterized protein n=1 Tax=Phytophthora kernoviae TaxID=325452 RepID=A0A421FVL0_9STRA|nr:hypothetical protein BBJ29_008487 [Phytophthora kernoviae]